MRTLFLFFSLVPLARCLPPHPAVVAVRQEEERLPHHLRSPALRNPHLREILPLTSLLHKGENAVYQRDTDDVSRQEIYNILTHAGLLPRRPGYYKPSKYRQRPHGHSGVHNHPHGHSGGHHHQHNDLTNDNYLNFLHNPELLQHL